MVKQQIARGVGFLQRDLATPSIGVIYCSYATVGGANFLGRGRSRHAKEDACAI